MAQMIAEWPDDSPAILVSPAYTGRQYLVSDILVSPELMSRALIVTTSPQLAEIEEDEDEDSNDLVSAFNVDWL